MRAKVQVLICGWLAITAAYAQSVSGTIIGIVKDPKGTATPRAQVTIESTSTGAEVSTFADERGFYRAANLEPGEYTIKVEAQGFRKAFTPGARLSAAEVLRIDVPLDIGQVTESITVSVPAVEVNTEDPQLGKTFREVSEAPLLSGGSGRNVLLLLGAQAGITFNTTGGFSANGQRIGSNSFLLDGADSTNIANALPDSVDSISPNAIAEFRLVTGVMKAEYGRNSGGVVMVTTKSGGNMIHGVASEIFRNAKLNAVPFFSKSVAGGSSETFADGTQRKPQWDGNDFDANFGGPFIKERSRGHWRANRGRGKGGKVRLSRQRRRQPSIAL